MKLVHPLVVLDLETTGTWIEKDKIIEIAMVKVFPDGHQETYDKRINPGMPLPACIIELTGITEADLEKAPAFKDVAAEVIAFIGDADLGGFNAERFDFPLLEREIRDVGLTFEWRLRKIYDAQKIYHLNQKRDLSAAYTFYCKKELENAHSALADTTATLDILIAQTQQYSEDDTLSSLDKFEYRVQSEFFDSERKIRWWNGKLYMMFGKYARRYSLQEVLQKDRKYLEWVLSADFSEDVKELVRNALVGKFPVPPTVPSREETEA
jgi:DNA polymerase III subunit epsilon